MKNILKISLLSLALVGVTQMHAGQDNQGNIYFNALSIRNDINKPVMIKNKTYAPGEIAVLDTRDQSGEVTIKAGNTEYSLLYRTGSAPIETFNRGNYKVSDIIAGKTDANGFSSTTNIALE